MSVAEHTTALRALLGNIHRALGAALHGAPESIGVAERRAVNTVLAATAPFEDEAQDVVFCAECQTLTSADALPIVARCPACASRQIRTGGSNR